MQATMRGVRGVETMLRKDYPNRLAVANMLAPGARGADEYSLPYQGYNGEAQGVDVAVSQRHYVYGLITFA